MAALYVRSDSVYKLIGADAWDAERDARRWRGGCPCVAHPPCAQWGRLRFTATVDPALKALGPLAVRQVRANGGVLEHPAHSTLWAHCALPLPGQVDAHGGWTLEAAQHRWGHRVAKLTWFYVVGLSAAELPALPPLRGEPTHAIRPRFRGDRTRLCLPRAEREETPPLLATWLMRVARLTKR